MRIETISPRPADKVLSDFGPAHYADAFRAALPAPGISVDHAVLTILGTSPGWVNGLLKLRHALVAPLGLKTAPGKHSPTLPVPPIAAGQYIRFFNVIDRSQDEIVLGEDDTHLDFRVSVSVDRASTDSDTVTVATYVHFNRSLGRFYFAVIRPFHVLIVKNAIGRGVRTLASSD